jgi:hypothetical protein
VWDTRAKAFTDPDTGAPLPTWDQACEELTEPAHVVRFGTQVHVKGILGGTEEAGRHVGYLTKYLTKSVGQAAGLDEHATDAQRDHAQQLHAELQITPCSPRCPVWLLTASNPKAPRHSMTPGRCKGKAHQPEHLGIAGRRVLVSWKWSNKILNLPLCSTSNRIAQRGVSAVRCDQPHRRRASPRSGARHASLPVDPSQGYPHRGQPAARCAVPRSAVSCAIRQRPM